MEAAAKKIYKTLISYFKKRDAFAAEGPRKINSFDCDSVLNEKQWYMYQGIHEVVRLTPSLHEYQDFINLSKAFWIKRNDEMVKNIRKYASEFYGKRLVVLCGFEHRYYLRRHLVNDEPPGFLL